MGRYGADLTFLRPFFTFRPVEPQRSVRRLLPRLSGAMDQRRRPVDADGLLGLLWPARVQLPGRPSHADTGVTAEWQMATSAPALNTIAIRRLPWVPYALTILIVAGHLVQSLAHRFSVSVY